MNKKIAVIAGYANPLRQKYLFSWYENLAREYENIKFFLGSKNKKIPYAWVYKSNTKGEKIKEELLGFLRLRPLAKNLKKISPLVRYDPDIIHLITFQTFSAIEPYLAVKNIKLVVSFRGYDLNVYPHQSEGNKANLQRIFKRADQIHFISEDLMQTGIALGADPQKSFVIRRSIWGDLNREIMKQNNQDTLVILSVGRLVWEKGYVYAMESIALLKKKGYKFQYRIVGDGGDLRMLQFHINRLDIHDRVVFTGELTREGVREELLRADMFLQASVTEALSNALIEASYYGIPIVSSLIGGIPEVVIHGKTGLLSPTCDPQGYAANIARLIENPKLREEMGENAHNRVMEYFSYEKELESWKAVYDGLQNG